MTVLSEKEKIQWLRLARSENVGAVTFQTLIKYWGSIENALEAIPDMAAKGGKKALKVCSAGEAEKEYENVSKIGAKIIASCEPEYPVLLGKIHDKPPVITALGNPHLLGMQNVAVVGARNASLTGKKFTKKLAYDLVELGFCVASGMAKGIDRAAHEGALAHDKSLTIAVLGSGIDVIYPSENKDLYEQLSKQACIISDFPLGMAPNRMNFPRRNRIISGLSLGTVVVEAEIGSGSLITANLALEQGREVFAVPNNPLEANAQGTNKLIQDGAHLVQSALDVMNVIRESSLLSVKEEQLNVFEAIGISRIDDTTLCSARKIVLENLSLSSITIDELVRETGLGYSAVSIVITELELAGKLQRLPGGKVSLIADI